MRMKLNIGTAILIGLNLIGIVFYYMGLNPVLGVTKNFAWYQPVTYSFMSNGLIHMILNVIGLYYFGNDVEDRTGTKAFLFQYFVGTILCGILISFTLDAYCVGSSAGVMALTAGYSLLYPNRKIDYLGVFLVKSYIFFLFVVFFSGLGYLLNSGPKANMHLIHFYGLAWGFVYFRFINKR